MPRRTRDPTRPPARPRQDDAAARLVHAARNALQTLAQTTANAGLTAVLTDVDGQVLDRIHGGSHAAATRLADVRLGMPLVPTHPDAATATVLDPESGTPCAQIGLVGPQARQRHDLQQIVALAAAAVELALLHRLHPAMLMRLCWPTSAHAPSPEGWLALDKDGQVLACTSQARAMAPEPLARTGPHPVGRVLSTTLARLQHASHHPGLVLSLALWSGVGVQVQVVRPEAGAGVAAPMLASAGLRWRDQEGGLIRHALQRAGGNVSAAARTMGMSRATLYRKLAKLRASARPGKGVA